jgi:hypothetical protein
MMSMRTPSFSIHPAASFFLVSLRSMRVDPLVSSAVSLTRTERAERNAAAAALTISFAGFAKIPLTATLVVLVAGDVPAVSRSGAPPEPHPASSSAAVIAAAPRPYVVLRTRAPSVTCWTWPTVWAAARP